jgi:hypothetical protein
MVEAFLMRALYSSHLRLNFSVVYRLNRVYRSTWTIFALLLGGGPFTYRISKKASTERGARQELPY